MTGVMQKITIKEFVLTLRLNGESNEETDEKYTGVI